MKTADLHLDSTALHLFEEMCSINLVRMFREGKRGVGWDERGTESGVFSLDKFVGMIHFFYELERVVRTKDTITHFVGCCPYSFVLTSELLVLRTNMLTERQIV